jgi:hypothetical protein
MQRGGLGANLLVYLSYMTQPPTCQPALSKEQGPSNDMGREHYSDVAESLIFGNQTLCSDFVCVERKGQSDFRDSRIRVEGISLLIPLPTSQFQNVRTNAACR